MKLRSKIIMIIIVSLILVGCVVALLLSPIGNKIKNVIVVDNTKEEIFTAYVDINPLIKLNFKVTCNKDNNCSSPVVTDSELINEDAKTIYKDLVLKDKSLSETIELLASTVKNNNIAFKEVHIYTNYDNENEFKIESVDYEIKLDVKKDEELKQVIDELIIEEANKKTKEILVPLTYDKSLYDSGFFPTKLKPLEHEELFVTSFDILGESDNENIPSLRTRNIHVKITVSGPAEVIDTLPDKYEINDGIDSLIYAIFDTKGLGEGTYTLPLKFITSKLDDIKILTPPIKCQFDILPKEDMYLTLEAY